jgi:hypothetical protein
MSSKGVLCKNNCQESYGVRCSRDCPCLRVKGGKAAIVTDDSQCKCTCRQRKADRVPVVVLG